jgi:hypothetical protein
MQVNEWSVLSVAVSADPVATNGRVVAYLDGQLLLSRDDLGVPSLAAGQSLHILRREERRRAVGVSVGSDLRFVCLDLEVLLTL